MVGAGSLFVGAVVACPLAMLADRACKISIRPESPSPQLLFHLGATLEDLFRRYAFEHRYDLRHAVPWHRLHQKMNVVFVRTYLQELDLVSLLYPKAHFLQNLLNIIVKYHPPVLRWKYQVVQQRRNVVTLVYVVTHPPKITPQGAGNLPALIEKLTNSFQSFATP